MPNPNLGQNLETKNNSLITTPILLSLITLLIIVILITLMIIYKKFKNKNKIKKKIIEQIMS